MCDLHLNLRFDNYQSLEFRISPIAVTKLMAQLHKPNVFVVGPAIPGMNELSVVDGNALLEDHHAAHVTKLYTIPSHYN